jgi:hypothetical protein
VSDDTARQWEWLRADLHTHCEDASQIDRYVGAIDDRLDVVALTNHAQKPVFAEQRDMLELLRQRFGGLMLCGIEWNAPGGGHACVLFPPCAGESDHAEELARRFDRRVHGASADIEAALAFLGDLPADERPLVFFNHPAPGQWTASVIAEYGRHGGALIAGLEALHGHQGYESGAHWDPESYPGSAVSGLADRVLTGGQRLALVAHSDYHVHKQDRLFDYGPGVFNHTLLAVPAGDRSAAAVFDAFRGGRTCAAQGHWLRLHDLRVEGPAGVVGLGETCRGGRALFEFEITETVRRVDWIACCGDGGVGVVSSRHDLPPGRHRLEWEVPAGARGFVRVRALAASQQRPAPGPTGPKAFLSSPIYLSD